MSSNAGDDPIVARLIGFQRRLHAYIFMLLPSVADADEVLQETNAAILRKRGECGPNIDFVAWALSVAYYEVLTHRKRHVRDRRCLLLDDDLLAKVAGVAAARAEEHESRLHALSDCMNRLAENDRHVIDLRYRSGLTSDAIAERLGRTAAAVRQVLVRIRGSLSNCIEHRLAMEEHR